MEPDVLVVGRGLGGSAAALAAAEAGARVLCVGRGGGATSLFAGLVEAGSHRPLSPGHPYTVCGVEHLQEALEHLADALERGGLPFSLHALQQSYSSATGVPVRARGAMPGLERGSAASLDSKRVGVWTFADPGSDAPPGARRIGVQPGATDARRAGLLETDEEARNALLSALDAAFSDAEVLLGPPVWGVSDHARTLVLAESACGRRLAEWVGGTTCARRLEMALERALVGAGVEVVTGEVVTPAVAGDRVASVRVLSEARGEALIRPGAVILATGRHLGGGVRQNQEPLFGLPIGDGEHWLHDIRPEDLATPYLERQPWALLGVRIDPGTHPLGKGGDPFSSNLFAAGDIVAGHDPALDGTGFGVAALLGAMAGRGAAFAAGKG